jgi:hypothetical protein
MTWILDHPERARGQRQARLIEGTRGAEIASTSQQPCSSGGQFRIAPFIGSRCVEKNTTASNSKTTGLSSYLARGNSDIHDDAKAKSQRQLLGLDFIPFCDRS